MQKGRRQDQWPQSWSPSNTTWGKGREWQVKKSLTWTGMAVGERVIGSFRSRPHRHGVFGGSGPRGRSESGTCSARLPGWVGEVCRTALASTPNVTIQEAQCRGEGSRHGTGPQPAVDMTAQIHGVGSGKDGQEQQLQLGSCCVAGGPAPGVSAVSAARRLAERAAAAAADTVPRGPRGPPDTGQQRCRTGLWHFAAEQYGSTGGSMRPRLPDQWYGPSRPCPLVPTRVMPAVRCRASTFGLEVNSLLHRWRIGDRRPRHIPEPMCRQEPHLEHRGGEQCVGDKYRPTSGTKELKKIAPATLPSAGRRQKATKK